MNDTIEIKLSKTGKHAGKYTAIFDSVDSVLAEVAWKVVIDSDSRIYAMRTDYIDEKQKSVYLHREIMERILGYPIPDGYKIDHKNGNPLDNRRVNLRLATNAENMRNRGKNANNKSGYKGVSWHKQSKKWKAQIKVNYKNKYLGLFDTPELAYAAYCEKAKELFGEFANLG